MIRRVIDSIASALLDPHASAALRRSVCDAFYAECTARLPSLDEQPTALAVGQALAPADAARCSLDHARTACLVRALDAQIAACHAHGGETRVLYAGCGPLAPLALLLARRWRGRGVVFDLVDIHAQSIDAAKHLFALADATEMLGDTRCADAATLTLDAARSRPRILVAEVMQRALSREPQVAVVANLLPQCTPEAALVPDRIDVDAALGDAAAHAAHTASASTLRLSPLLSLSRDSCPGIAAAIRGGATCLPEVCCQVPADAQGLHLMLATRIDAGEGETLVDYESGPTTPQFVFELGPVRAGEILGFTYRLGRDPGFAIRRIEA